MMGRALLGCVVVCGVILYKAPHEKTSSTAGLDGGAKAICGMLGSNRAKRTKFEEATRAKTCACVANVLKVQLANAEAADLFEVVRYSAGLAGAASGRNVGGAIELLQKHRAALKAIDDRCGVENVARLFAEEAYAPAQ